MPGSPKIRLKGLLRLIAAGSFLFTGTLHFLDPEMFQRIVPPRLPAPAALVAISGICEIAGGIGLLIPPLRRWAGLGLVALLIAVFPANIYMTLAPDKPPASHFPHWVLWGRLPFQGILILWVWWVALAHQNEQSATMV